jgi:NAD(P)-dependent dehydrogenase (short-subunit alcohol dehydrogenase family)
LTNLLLPKITERVVTVASMLHLIGYISLKDINWKARPYSSWVAYGQSKLANLLFTYALHDKIAEERPAFAAKVKSLCAHPGPTNSGLQAKTAKAGGTRLLDQYILWTAAKFAQSVEDGAMGIIRACCAPGVESLDFYGPAVFRRGGPAELLPQERNAAGEKLLWLESLKATGVSKFFG